MFIHTIQQQKLFPNNSLLLDPLRICVVKYSFAHEPIYHYIELLTCPFGHYLTTEDLINQWRCGIRLQTTSGSPVQQMRLSLKIKCLQNYLSICLQNNHIANLCIHYLWQDKTVLLHILSSFLTVWGKGIFTNSGFKVKNGTFSNVLYTGSHMKNQAVLFKISLSYIKN